MKRRGFTAIEILIAVLLIGMVAGMISSFSTGASRTSNRTLASEDATRAILLASETIGSDLRRAVVDITTPDLVAAADGRGLSFQMASAKYADWTAPSELVTYEVVPAPKDPTLRHLVRVTAKGRHVIPCLLKDVVFQVRPPGKDSPWRMTVLITLVAPLTAHDARTLSVEIPVSRALPPPAYPWPAPGSEKA